MAELAKQPHEEAEEELFVNLSMCNYRFAGKRDLGLSAWSTRLLLLLDTSNDKDFQTKTSEYAHEWLLRRKSIWRPCSFPPVDQDGS